MERTESITRVFPHKMLKTANLYLWIKEFADCLKTLN